MSFKALNLSEGNSRNTRAMIVGVAAYLWLTQCQAVFYHPRHAQAGRSPELRTLFFKLAALNDAGVIAVFIFDGPNRPPIKRNKRVRAQPHWLVEEFQELIELFGFYSYTAPGEGEAELACLSQHGLIDAVLTDNGDTFLFGAQRIIRTLNDNAKDEITVYTSNALQSSPQVGLTRGGILLLAVMRGGDYDTVGLAGCGIAVAHALARCGFGDSLLTAAQNMLAPELQEFLVTWRQEVRLELQTNSQGHLRFRQPCLAKKIPDSFPDVRALLLYSCPITSWSDGFLPPTSDGWIIKLPSLPELALHCKRKFGWPAVTIVDKFKRMVFAGVFAKRLMLPFNPHQQLHDHVVLGRIREEQPPLSAFLQIISYDESTPEFRKYKIKTSVGGLAQWILSRLDAPAAAAGSASATSSQWIFAPAAEQYFPWMTAKYHGIPVSNAFAFPEEN
ncbi:PIN domain-like protein [Mycena galopus ATCC 62051]|nr:PIN domain-like protein [Mycena galopus ATCC 62051]